MAKLFGWQIATYDVYCEYAGDIPDYEVGIWKSSTVEQALADYVEANDIYEVTDQVGGINLFTKKVGNKRWVLFNIFYSPASNKLECERRPLPPKSDLRGVSS